MRRDDLAIDLGSNDGTMLAAFKAQGLKALGVEPAKLIAQHASENGLPTIGAYFTRKLSDWIKTKYGPAKLITANYMFANIPDFHDFLSGINNLLADNGAFVMQTGYHPDQFQLGMFDYIYHEHFSYFTQNHYKTCRRYQLKFFLPKKVSKGDQ